PLGYYTLSHTMTPSGGLSADSAGAPAGWGDGSAPSELESTDAVTVQGSPPVSTGMEKALSTADQSRRQSAAQSGTSALPTVRSAPSVAARPGASAPPLPGSAMDMASSEANRMGNAQFSSDSHGR